VSRIARAVVASFLAVFVAFSLAGCLKFNIALKVNEGDSVTGSVVVAMSKELASLAAGDPSSMKTDGIFPAGPGITSKAFTDGKFVGTQYDFTNVPLAAFNTGDSKLGQLRITRDGENLVTSGALDFTGSSSADMSSNPMAKALMASMDLKIAITYPGKILETTGKASGNTITWTPEYGKKTEISAVVSAPFSVGFQWTWIIIGAAAVIVAVVVVLVVVRARRKKSAPAISE
jgi:hypothetical protein